MAPSRSTPQMMQVTRAAFQAFASLNKQATDPKSHTLVGNFYTRFSPVSLPAIPMVDPNGFQELGRAAQRHDLNERQRLNGLNVLNKSLSMRDVPDVTGRKKRLLAASYSLESSKRLGDAFYANLQHSIKKLSRSDLQ